MNDSDPLRIAQLLFERAAAGDVDGYLELVDPDAEMRPLTRPRVLRGHEGVREFFGGDRPQRFVVKGLRLGAVGDVVIATGVLTRPAFLGGTLELPAAWAMRFRDARLVRSDAYHRLADALAAAGIAPDGIDLQPPSSSV